MSYPCTTSWCDNYVTKDKFCEDCLGTHSGPTEGVIDFHEKNENFLEFKSSTKIFPSAFNGYFNALTNMIVLVVLIKIISS